MISDGESKSQEKEAHLVPVAFSRVVCKDRRVSATKVSTVGIQLTLEPDINLGDGSLESERL